MRRYVVHDDDGNILRYGVCPTAEVAQKTRGPNEHVLEIPALGRALDVTHRVVTQGPERRMVRKGHDGG